MGRTRGALVLAAAFTGLASAQPAAPRLEISGQVMLDAIYDFKRVDPDWNATLRPSTIPVNCPGDAGCGKDGETIMSIRQSKLAFKGFIPTPKGELTTLFDFDLFDVGGGNTHARVLNAGPSWALRRRPDRHAVHGHRHLPQHHRLLGTERHGVPAQPAAALSRPSGATTA